MAGPLFKPEGKSIRVPVRYIKGLTERTSERLLTERDREPFASLADFYRRVTPSPDEMEAMLRVGAFDEFEKARTAQFWKCQFLQRTFGTVECGFQGLLLPPPGLDRLPEVSLQEPTRRERLESENELLGFPASGHPLELHDHIAWDTYCPVSRLATKPAVQYRAEELPKPVQAIRYYLPLEIYSSGRPSGRFHYCCYVYPTGEIAPVGHCSDRCAGHASKDAAREHYRIYLVDEFGRYNFKSNGQSACSVCGRIATQHAWVEFHKEWESYPLCRQHMNNAGLRQVFTFEDYHLLQISDPQHDSFTTVCDATGQVSITKPSLSLKSSERHAPKL